MRPSRIAARLSHFGSSHFGSRSSAQTFLCLLGRGDRCWSCSLWKTLCVDGSEGMDPRGGPGRMDTSSSGSETQSGEMEASVCAQFVSRADASQAAIQRTLEARSFSATAAHRSTSSPICIGSVGSRGAMPEWESKRH